MDDLSLAYNAYLSLIFTYLTLIVRLRLYSFRGNYPLFELRSSPVLHGRRGSRSGPLCGVFLPPIMPFWKESVLFLSFLWHFIIDTSVWGHMGSFDQSNSVLAIVALCILLD